MGCGIGHFREQPAYCRMILGQLEAVYLQVVAAHAVSFLITAFWVKAAVCVAALAMVEDRCISFIHI